MFPTYTFIHNINNKTKIEQRKISNTNKIYKKKIQFFKDYRNSILIVKTAKL